MVTASIAYNTQNNLRKISRDRVRFTYRITPERANDLGVASSDLDLQTHRDRGTSYRFEVSKTGSVRVTRRAGDRDISYPRHPSELMAMLLHDVHLQRLLTHAIFMATNPSYKDRY